MGNELAVSGIMETDPAEVADAVVIVMPPLDKKDLGGKDATLCNLNQWALAQIETDLINLWERGLGHLPVVIMEQILGAMDDQQCKDYWGGKDCKTAYRKSIFAQSFFFEKGSCLMRWHKYD